jgi:hypothetical protein
MASYVGYTDSGSDTFSSPTFSTAKQKYAVVMLAYFQSGTPALPSNVTIDGNNMSLEVSVTSVGDDPKCIIGIYTYPVPSSWNGTSKTVDVSGGTHGDHHRACCVEASLIGGAGQTASDDNDEDLTISGCIDTSLLLCMIATWGASTPSLSSGGTLITAGNLDSADNRYDRGWGWAYGTPSSGSNTFNWTANDRCIAAVELFTAGGGAQVIML